MEILFVLLESGLGHEAQEQVFNALSALGYDGQHITDLGPTPVIGVSVHDVSAHQEPTEEQIKELEALPAVYVVITVQ